MKKPVLVDQLHPSLSPTWNCWPMRNMQLERKCDLIKLQPDQPSLSHAPWLLASKWITGSLNQGQFSCQPDQVRCFNKQSTGCVQEVAPCGQAAVRIFGDLNGDEKLTDFWEGRGLVLFPGQVLLLYLLLLRFCHIWFLLWVIISRSH